MEKEKKVDSTSTFVILLRIFLGLVLAAAVGVGIYFIATSGTNTLAAFYAYNDQVRSSHTIYLDEKMEEDGELYNFAQVNQGESKFTQNYQFYTASRAIFEQFAPELYFNQSTEGVSELASSIRKYTGAQAEIVTSIEEFLRTKAAGASTSSLQAQLVIIQDKLLALTHKLTETNQLLVPFVVQNCLGGEVEYSLKYSMLDVIFRQSQLVDTVLNSADLTPSEKSMASGDLTAALVSFENEEALDFANQIITENIQAQFVEVYAQLTESDKSGFMGAVNKVEYANSLSPALKEKLLLISGLFGFGEA